MIGAGDGGEKDIRTHIEKLKILKELVINQVKINEISKNLNEAVEKEKAEK